MITNGCLYIVGTPIGNPRDITLRALDVLREVDVIAAEDTRNTGRLLQHHGIRTRLISFQEHNEERRIPDLMERLGRGNTMALVSDAGTPSVSDPGYRLVEAAIAAGVPVVPVPGPSAAVSALSVAGLPTDAFCFAGFLPRKAARRQKALAGLANLPQTLIFYESPRRIVATMQAMVPVFGDRRAVLAREMTKPYEEFVRGSLSQIAADLQGRDTVRGECTLLVEGAGAPQVSIERITEALTAEMARGGQPISAIARQVARHLGVSRKTVYDQALRLKNNP